MGISIPAPPPDLARIQRDLLSKKDGAERLLEILTERRIGPEPGGRYRSWDKLQHLDPPAGLSNTEWWLAVKHARQTHYRAVPLRDKSGHEFAYALTDAVLAYLHRIDRDAAGQIQLPEEVTNESTRDRYIVSSLIEESITSSQLEGASTTRRVAVEMLRSERTPRNKSERMIRNNYLAMQRIRGLRDTAMTPQRILALHRILTDGTLDDPADVGRFRVADDIKVWSGDEVLHDPPTHVELEERLASMCAFANQTDDSTHVHPVIRAVTIHFWLAYVHPFADGNGRTARALFYWSLLRSGYWLAEFVSISRLLKRAWAQYARSFLYTESDENDLTYFVLFQLHVFCRSIDALKRYLSRKAGEVRRIEELLCESDGFNHRQIALLGRAVKDAGSRFSVKSHQTSHNVVYETARTDLLKLEEAGFLQSRKVGRARVYTPVDDIEARLRGAVE